MSEPYVGEIRMFGGNFAPAGWMFCEGQILPISEYDALFALIGTTYGGDGQETFALPDLRGRAPVHQGNGVILGEVGGAEVVTLTAQQIPGHAHPARANAGDGNAFSPVSGAPAVSKGGIAQYGSRSGTPIVAMNAGAIAPAGGSQPHDNMMPYLAVSFIISLYGVFPSQN